MANPNVQGQLVQLQATSELRRKLKDFADSLTPLDGSNRDELRKWLQDIDNIRAWTNAPDALVIDLAGQKSSGPLRAALLAARDQIQLPANRTWPNVKVVISEEFLERDEQQHLQLRLDNMVQEPFEDLRAYARRFIDLRDMAYPPNEVNIPSVRNRLISLYLGGIYDDHVRQQASRGRQNRQLHEVMRDSFDIEGSFMVPRRGGPPQNQRSSAAPAAARKEEPMDISAVVTSSLCTQLDKFGDKMEQKFKSVQGEMKALRNKGPAYPDPVVAAVKPEAPHPTTTTPVQHQQQQQQPGAPWMYPTPQGAAGNVWPQMMCPPWMMSQQQPC